MQSLNDKNDLSSNNGKLCENTSAIIGGSDKLIQPLLSCNNNNVNENLNRCIEPMHLSKIVSVNQQNGYHSSNEMMFKDKPMEHVKLLVADQCSNESSSSTTPVSCMPPPPSYAAAVNTNAAAVVIESDAEEDGDEHLKSCHAQRSNTCENCGQVVVSRPCDGASTPVPPSQPTVVATSSAAAAPTPTNGVEDVVGGGLTKTSSGGSISSCSLQVDFCRICHCEADSEMGRLIAPCKCKGTLRNVHQACLQQWIKSSDCKHCELCGFHFAMNTKLKPISKWEKLSMSTSERRKIMCSVIFHLVAITCVVWSLYVLIERTAEELNQHKLQWPFWTKLVVVAIGFAGGLVFMYVQCKIYVQLWRRLKAFNRIIYVQHQPSSPSIDEQQQTAQQIVASNNQQLPPQPTAVITTVAVDDDDSRSAVVLLGGGDKNASAGSGSNSSSVAYQYPNHHHHHQNNARQEEVVLVEVNPQS